MKEENNSIQSFENKAIRTAWNEEQEEWYFSVTDIVAALTDSADPKQYIKKMLKKCVLAIQNLMQGGVQFVP